MTASVRPCVGRTLPTSRGIQSICAFMMPEMAPWRSGLHQTWPSDHADNARSSCTLGWSGVVLSGNGRSRGSNIRVSAPSRSNMRAASSTRSRLNERLRSEPYSSRMRGRCVARALGSRLSIRGPVKNSGCSAGNEIIDSFPVLRILIFRKTWKYQGARIF